LALGRLDDGVDDVGVGRSDGQTDPTQFHVGEAGRDLRPGLAGVGAAVEGALGTAVDEGPDVTAALVGGGEEDVGVAAGAGDAGVVVDVQDALPVLAAVAALVQATVAAAVPQRALGGDVDGVRVARVDEDLADVLGAFEAQLLPGFAAIGRAINAIAVADAAL